LELEHWMKEVTMMENKDNKETKGWIVGMGTGNAICRVCEQVITLEQSNIKLVGYRVSGQIHSNPFDCSDARQIALGFEPLEE
jgi:hypothetical protein